MNYVKEFAKGQRNVKPLLVEQALLLLIIQFIFQGIIQVLCTKIIGNFIRIEGVKI